MKPLSITADIIDSMRCLKVILVGFDSPHLESENPTDLKSRFMINSQEHFIYNPSNQPWFQVGIPLNNQMFF
jgi:hypothetical protein